MWVCMYVHGVHVCAYVYVTCMFKYSVCVFASGPPMAESLGQVFLSSGGVSVAPLALSTIPKMVQKAQDGSPNLHTSIANVSLKRQDYYVCQKSHWKIFCQNLHVFKLLSNCGVS